MKNLETMYIISWFGNTNEIKEKRRKYHLKQIQWAKNNNLNTYILPQFYNKSDYVDGINYIETGVGHLLIQPEARNILLKHFYNSSENYAIFADNDSILYEEGHCDSNDFFNIFNKIPLESLNDIDLFFPLNPQQMPFNKDFEKNAIEYKNNFVFKRCPDSKGSFLIVKNLKKFYNKEIYFDCDFISKERTLIAHEDQAFGFEFLKNGYSCYMLKNIVLNELTGNSSTWVDQKDRKAKNQFGKELLAKKFNLIKSAKGLYNYNEVYKHSNRPKIAYVTKNGSDFETFQNKWFE